MFVLLGPLAPDESGDTSVTGTHMMEFFGETGFHVQMTVSLCTFFLTNTCQVLIIPQQQVAQQHHMIAAIHGRIGRISIPQFPNGGGTVVYHVSVTGICALAHYLHCQVGLSLSGQCAHQVLHPQYATTYMLLILVLYDVCDVLHHLLLISLRHKPQCQ